MEKRTKNIGLLLLGSALIIAIYAISQYTIFSAKSDTEDCYRSDTLTLVTDYSPIGYFVQGDSIAGINNDLIKLFQQYTSLQLNLELESSLEKSLEGLASGKYDIIARGIPITSELKDKVLFSQPFTHTRQVLVQRKAEYNDDISPVRSHLNLAGKVLYVPKDSPNILRINNLIREIGDTIQYIEDELYGEEQLAIMVANKEIDFAVCDQKIAKKIAASQPELDITTSMGFTQLEAWVVSQNRPDVLDSLNTWIDKAKQKKELNKIYRRYIE